MTQHLFPKYKLLLNVENLSLTTSLLARKWFVSIMLDAFLFDMVVLVWYMRINQGNDRIIHLALALQYVETVIQYFLYVNKITLYFIKYSRNLNFITVSNRESNLSMSNGCRYLQINIHI